jgi:hypothetical protein
LWKDAVETLPFAFAAPVKGSPNSSALQTEATSSFEPFISLNIDVGVDVMIVFAPTFGIDVKLLTSVYGSNYRILDKGVTTEIHTIPKVFFAKFCATTCLNTFFALCSGSSAIHIST